MTLLMLFLTRNLKKEKFLFYSGVYSGIKTIINILISGLIVRFLNIAFDLHSFVDMLVLGIIYVALSTFDSWLIFRKTKEIRNLSMSNKEYVSHCVKNYGITIASLLVISMVRKTITSAEDFVFVAGCLLCAWVYQFVMPYMIKATNKITEFENEKMVGKLKEACPRKYKIFVYEGSKQKSANAITTGTFLNRHIFISSYFLENATEDEIFAILLHECGHCEFFDLEKRAVFVDVCFVLLFIATSLMDYYKIGILSGFIFLGVCFVAGMSFYKWTQRFQEYRADRYSVQITKNKASLISALEKLFFLNDMEKKKSAFWNIISSHPSYKKRISRIQNINSEKEN